jgi:methylated-DNA-[protein]-cysteine S-methyltransferase
MPAVVHAMPWGFLLVEEQGGALTRVQCLRPEERETSAVSESTPLLREACAQLDAYFEGRLRRFDLPLSPQGTQFQRRVWEELRRIGWGSTRSYGEVARAVGSPRGARAVGMACNRNPLLLVVPCHRVVGADGSLVGFGGGLELKRRLLELERVLLPLEN